MNATRVLRVALETAVSSAGMLLLTEATLTDVPSREQERRTPAEA